ncbi:hypothetical protein VIGAN_02238700, partial [Vigna angularis var. angularis]
MLHTILGLQLSLSLPIHTPPKPTLLLVPSPPVPLDQWFFFHSLSPIIQLQNCISQILYKLSLRSHILVQPYPLVPAINVVCDPFSPSTNLAKPKSPSLALKLESNIRVFLP